MNINISGFFYFSSQDFIAHQKDDCLVKFANQVQVYSKRVTIKSTCNRN